MKYESERVLSQYNRAANGLVGGEMVKRMINIAEQSLKHFILKKGESLCKQFHF
jgi:hypothetical protein